jgi:nitrogen fixation NifU-like protein
MSELSDLYQEVILDHNKRPRNFGTLEDPDREAHGHNPLCGDRWTVTMHVRDGVIRAVRFTGAGCAISKASASLMTEAVCGGTVDEALQLFERFQTLLTSPLDAAPDDARIGKLSVLGGVREFPMRVKCATLAWHTLKSAIVSGHGTVKTE